VSVVVVVVGPGTAGCVVCDDVVVVLPEGVDPQADKRAMVAASRLGMMIFFMVIFRFLDFCFTAPSSHTRARGDYGVLPAGTPAGWALTGAAPGFSWLRIFLYTYQHFLMC
jgi:hypothetical protein